MPYALLGGRAASLRIIGMGIRRRRPTTMVMAVTAVLLTYVYFQWQQPYSPATYSGGSRGFDEHPRNALFKNPGEGVVDGSKRKEDKISAEVKDDGSKRKEDKISAEVKDDGSKRKEDKISAEVKDDGSKRKEDKISTEVKDDGSKRKEDTISAEVKDDGSKRKEDTISAEVKDDGSKRKEDTISAEVKDDGSKRKEDTISAEVKDDGSKRKEDTISAEVKDDGSKRKEDKISAEVKDDGSKRKEDTISAEVKDDGSKRKEDKISAEVKDDGSKRKEDKISTEVKDDESKRKEDKISVEVKDDGSLRKEDKISAEVKDDGSKRKEDKISAEVKDDGSKQKEDKNSAEVKGDEGKDRHNVENEDKPKPPLDEETSHASRLIVLAYMRTGSTMVGRLLKLSPDVFFVYEPLHTLERYYVTKGHPNSFYRNATRNEMFKDSAMAAGNTSAMLSCDIAHVYSGVLLDPFMSYGNHHNIVFHKCFQTADSLPDATMRVMMWAQCEINMTRMCRKAYKSVVAKTIRLTVARALDIMRRDPKVKVLHLVRDPRAILLSRYTVGYADMTRLTDEGSRLCGKMQEDLERAYDRKALQDAEELELRKRYWLVRYEDVATAPVDFIRSAYEFMGINITKFVVETVKIIMDTAKHDQDCPTCPLTKLNSTQVAQAWRRKLTMGQVKEISDPCARVTELLGYQAKFDDEDELRDFRSSAIGPLKLKLK